MLQVSIAAADKNTQADILMIVLPVSAGLMAMTRQDTQGVWMLTKSLSLSAASTLALNSIIDKESPDGSNQQSFPSGHAAIAFGSAAFVQRRYGWRWGMPAYAVATYAGWLRVETDDHDVADIFAGAAVGILSSYLFTRPFGANVDASAWADGQSAGIRAQIRW